MKKTLLGVLALTLSLAACATPKSTSETSKAAAKADCPTTPTSVPAGPPQGGPPIVLAKSVAPSDTSTSTVIKGDGPQIQCGATEIETKKDITYSTPTTGPLKLDVQTPKTAGAKPLVVYLTGGGFVMAPKESALPARTYVAEAGFVVASIQYRTIMNGATYRDGVADVKAAIRFLRANAAEYGVDPSKVAVWGDSAGGYLAAMTGATNGLAEFEVGDHLDQSSAVRAVVNKFGASDLSKTAADFDVAAQQAALAPDNNLAQYVFGPPGGKSVLDDPAAVAKANPVTYVDANDPPELLMHGSADTIMSPSQTLLLHDALRAAGVDSTRYVLDGASHGDLAFPGDPNAGLPWSSQQAMNVIVDFLHGHLK
jgi:acetyl esterase/lipase